MFFINFPKKNLKFIITIEPIGKFGFCGNKPFQFGVFGSFINFSDSLIIFFQFIKILQNLIKKPIFKGGSLNFMRMKK